MTDIHDDDRGGTEYAGEHPDEDDVAEQEHPPGEVAGYDWPAESEGGEES